MKTIKTMNAAIGIHAVFCRDPGTNMFWHRDGCGEITNTTLMVLLTSFVILGQCFSRNVFFTAFFKFMATLFSNFNFFHEILW